MSDLFFEQLEIPKPNINFEIGSGTQGEQTGRMLEAIEKEMINIRPDLLICFGDTNSTLAACLAAAKLSVPSVHIEAGLRSFNRSMPEEINRVVADHTADLLFAPTETAMQHLHDEGLSKRSVLTGDIMVDSVKFVQQKIGSNIYNGKPYYLLTIHRPYNVDDPQKIKALFELIAAFDRLIIFPVHPRTRKIMADYDIKVPANTKLMEPQGYIEFQGLLKYAEKVITDSGGLQKEAYLAKKPCITLRSETEWVETVRSGWNLLCSFNDHDLVAKVNQFQPPLEHPSLYGENVAVKMIHEIEQWMG